MSKPKGNFFKFLIRLVLIGAAICIFCNVYICVRGGRNILSSEEAAKLTDVDYIIVLGAKVNPGGAPSHMLEDRIKTGISVFESGLCDKLLMSGDGRTEDYNEIRAMKTYAEKAGVPSENIDTDRYGLSTFESIYRVKEVFGAKKIIIITQKYHLYRALYIADWLGIEAYGVSADLRTYSSQIKQDAREFLARTKEFFYMLTSPMPEYTGL